MSEKNYLTVWFNGRRRYGIDNTIYLGWLDPQTNHTDWQTWRHADGDGLYRLPNALPQQDTPLRRFLTVTRVPYLAGEKSLKRAKLTQLGSPKKQLIGSKLTLITLANSLNQRSVH